VEDALGHETRTQYNALGYRTVVTDANDAVTHYSYDGLNRLSGVHYVSDNVTVTYRYDAASNRTVMTDTLGTTLYVYDDLGRLVSVSDPLTGTVEYGYDLVGNRTQLVYPGGQVVTYTYDADDRLVQVEDWSGGLTGYEYDVATHLITTTLPNGVTTTYQYDAANRLIDLAHTATDDTLLSSYSYELDDTGNRVRVVETLTETTRTITSLTITSTVSPRPTIPVVRAFNMPMTRWAIALPTPPPSRRRRSLPTSMMTLTSWSTPGAWPIPGMNWAACWMTERAAMPGTRRDG
jgi:YD repeat-containing protein